MITVESLSHHVGEDDGYMTLVIEGGGVKITVADVYLTPEDREKLTRALDAHDAAISALKGKACTESCTNCNESCSATWVPDHIVDANINAFFELEF